MNIFSLCATVRLAMVLLDGLPIVRLEFIDKDTYQLQSMILS